MITGHKFLIEKGIKSNKDSLSPFVVEQWLEEFVEKRKSYKENKRMTEKEILSWMMDAYIMLGEKNDKGEDERKSLLHALINIVKEQNK